MADLIQNNAKYEQWRNSHNFNNCKLKRKNYGEFLADYITGEQDGFVLNLNGSWGTGKTEFLKRFYSYLLVKEHPVVYINSWESDFSKEPLTVITSELLSQFEKFNSGIGSEETTKRVKQLCGKALKAALVGVAGFTSAKILNDSNIGMETIKQMIESDSENFTKQLTKEYTEQIEAIHGIRKSLGQLAEVLQKNYGAKLPAVILVDELDRCRPTHAIEMLEVIKHFFTTDNFVFVIATDTEQLSHSIKSVYGAEFDSNQYLKRFFDRKVSLPEPDLEHYISATSKGFTNYSSLSLFPLINQGNLEKEVNSIIAKLASAFKLKIRDVDQLFSKMHSCLRSICVIKEGTEKKQIVNIAALIIGLIEQDGNFEPYENRNDSSHTYTPPINKDIEFGPDLNINLYIEKNMQCVVTMEVSTQDPWGRNITQQELPNPRDLRNIMESNSSAELQNFIGSLSTNINNYKRAPEQAKYWMWSDLKKIIELAGNIE
ncbi:KAP family P-loop NTPase fold protein [Thalassotalea atypica]|uniref:KAP family P-loop NTPase fold protein n=1 Tax=Thalassotalea atypica TaxID=2054316 RepID=UPI0025735699|nr:P-loop NTPase fold protein [Thalassotalea atypica]